MFSQSCLFNGLAFFSILFTLAQAYSLVSTFDASNFMTEFDFFTGGDPTLGFVDYLSEELAEALGTVSGENNQIYLGVDSTTYNPVGGRRSIRLSSKQAYTQGVFIADIAHMPGGICGTWPAFWMFGPNWPASGEIDIIEGVNAQTTDSITLHTGPGCTIRNTNSQPGTNTITSNCNENDGDTGCSVSTSNTNSYGAGFNAAGGGVYAMQWASTGIYVWFWSRSSIPSDIANGEIPNVQSWGQPLATFESDGEGGCDIDASFANNNIVFDTTFCGQWAGEVWGSSSCAALAPTCNEYVANNPAAFFDAYWLINSVKVYQ